jgi:hypothetical protein
MRRLVFDIETDGLIHDLEVVHCINLIDREVRKVLSFNTGRYADGSSAPRDGSVEDGLKLLEDADWIGGQNILNFDIPALQAIYPGFKPRGQVFDTQVCSQVIYTDLTDIDFDLIRKKKLPPVFQELGLVGRHSLEAWGYRLGEFKGEFKPEKFLNSLTNEPHTWKSIGYTQAMDEYARQDPVVTLKLVEKMESKNYAPECLALEHDTRRIITRQEVRGFAFNDAKANDLTRVLQGRRADLDAQLRQTFEPWYAPDGPRQGEFVPKRDNTKMGYVGGAPVTKVKLVQFNPGSRDHIAQRLIKLFNWVPTEFTDGGAPKVDETTLDGLPYPEAKLCKEFLMVTKRLGMLAEGESAWLVKVRKGRIHGRVTTNGAVTGRMTHSEPNVAQTPKVKKGKEGVLFGGAGGYGAECRELFMATPGFKLVGCDAEGLELRTLAHYMAFYDNGAYAQTVVNGRKEDKTDVHSINMGIAGFNSRDNAKTLIYAFLYGAGDYKLGTIALDDMTEARKTEFFTRFPAGGERDAAVASLGKALKAKFLKGLPALKSLIDAVKGKVKANGGLRGLDGRSLNVRSAHSALNTLLQSAGAIVMKRALQLLDAELQAEGMKPGIDYEFVANVHDEFQIEVKEDHEEKVGRRAAAAIKKAGETFKLRCPLAGDFAIGNNWKETH